MKCHASQRLASLDVQDASLNDSVEWARNCPFMTRASIWVNILLDEINATSFILSNLRMRFLGAKCTVYHRSNPRAVNIICCCAARL